MTERDTEQMYAGIVAWRREQRLARAEKRRANITLPRLRGRAGRCGRPLKNPGAREMTPTERTQWGYGTPALRPGA